MGKGLIQAALSGKGKYAGNAYFFRNRQYARYNWKQDKVDYGPEEIKAWNLQPAFSEGLTAALEGQHSYSGYAYFFKNTQYMRYNWTSGEIDGPRSLAAWGLTGTFLTGIDAAVNGKGKYKDYAYFFKGNQYVRYNWITDTPDNGYPQNISAWKLSGVFASGIDGAINGEGEYEGYIYFFKNNMYIKYNWETDSIVGEPRTIETNWPLLSETLQLNLDQSLFYRSYINYSNDTQTNYQIPALFTLAQSALETGWNKAKPGNNMFGIKAGGSWTGKKQLLVTTEYLPNRNYKFPEIISIEEVPDPNDASKKIYKYTVKDWFRAYDSPLESFNDRAEFLKNSPQFKRAFTYTDPYNFAKAIADGGYATAKNYYTVLAAQIKSLENVKKILDQVG